MINGFVVKNEYVRKSASSSRVNSIARIGLPASSSGWMRSNRAISSSCFSPLRCASRSLVRRVSTSDQSMSNSSSYIICASRSGVDVAQHVRHMRRRKRPHDVHDGVDVFQCFGQLLRSDAATRRWRSPAAAATTAAPCIPAEHRHVPWVVQLSQRVDALVRHRARRRRWPCRDRRPLLSSKDATMSTCPTPASR